MKQVNYKGKKVFNNETKRIFTDLTGERFTRWLVVEYIGRINKNPIYRCRCDCGTEKQVNSGRLLNGTSKSCGCLHIEQTIKHGHIRNNKRTKEYRMWIGMKNRCFNPNADQYHNYGGRGITVCEEWKESFEAFLNYVGPCPSTKHSLDRIDVNGDYEPGNVRYATTKEQCNNKRNNHRLEYNGESHTITEWGELLGIGKRIILTRLRAKWPVAKTLTTPIKQNRILQLNGENLTVSEWVEKLGISKEAINRRLRYGWSDEKVLTTPIRKRKKNK